MKQLSLFFLAVFCSCSQPAKQQIVTQPTKAEKVIERPFSNPAIIYGSDFGKFFQGLYRTNNYKGMLDFTSTETLNKFSSEQVLDYYKDEFKFDYVLGNLSNISMEEGITILTYNKASIFATRRKLQIPVIIESDSVKIILNTLSSKPFE